MRRSRADRTWRRKASAGSCCNPTWADCQSFADELVTERGIVNVRVGTCYYPLRLLSHRMGFVIGRVGTCYYPLRLSLRLQICPIGYPKGRFQLWVGGITSERPLQLVAALLPVSGHCCSVYTWVNLRQVARLYPSLPSA